MREKVGMRGSYGLVEADLGCRAWLDDDCAGFIAEDTITRS
jgi:hypothetical protein